MTFTRFRSSVSLIAVIVFAACAGPERAPEAEETDDWQLLPFQKANDYNPVLSPITETTFYCPIRNELVNWEAKDVFNPAAIVVGDTLFLIYRAEDTVGIHSGTSRIGLAFSFDGLHFERLPEPVLYPDEDAYKEYEWEGGLEDPRVIVSPDGSYILTYTSYDGETARLCIAESDDLRNWTKYGPVFQSAFDGEYVNQWSKSGSIVGEMNSSHQIEAVKINGKFWMYWGDTDLYIAWSDDLLNWTPVENDDGELLSVLAPRPGMFDSRLVEPGPPAILTDNGILLLYNGMNLDPNQGGTSDLPTGTYASGQALFDPADPKALLERSDSFFLHPDQPYEIIGQIGNVCFIEGLVYYKSMWYLYFGTADSKIAVATSESPSFGNPK